MLIRLRAAAIIAACLMLAGCATQPVIPFDKSMAGDIKTVGIVTPAMPEKPSVWLASTIGQSFGLIGALVDAGMEASREKDFWTEIDGAHNPPKATFLTAMTEALQAQGYTVKTIDVKDRKSDFLKSYPPAQDTQVDAYLDVRVFNYGYVAAGIGDSTPYRPFAYVDCKMIRASDNAVLMQDDVFYNPITQGPVRPSGNGVTISPNPDYVFVDFDALKADPPNATKGMNDALQQAAAAVANLAH